MTAVRGQWLIGAAAALVVLLFAGQWIADLLAERWWAAAVIPDAAAFVSGVRLLRLTLDAAAVLLGTAWFTGHLLVVHRAIGSVQVSRQLANLEIREAVTPTTLLPLAVAAGACLGLAAGLLAGREWSIFALAWQGVTYGVTDPYLHRDLGVFVAQLPLWMTLHSFASLLVWSALMVVMTLYATLGAIKWQGGRPAISGHARRHLGFLLAGAALVLAWGFLLQPFVVAAEHAPDPAAWNTIELSMLALVGACVAASAISCLWALRGQHLLMVAAWGVLLVGMLAVRVILPGAETTGTEAPAAARIALDRLAYGLTRVDDRSPGPPGSAAAPSLWTAATIGRLLTADSMVVESANQATIAPAGVPIPVWMAVRAAPGGSASVMTVADARTGPGSGPVSFRAEDSLAYPGIVTFANLPAGASRPGAPRLVVDSGVLGLVAGGLPRRLVLAWALQDAALLAPLGPSARIRWHLAPRERLERLAGFALWDSPKLIEAGGSLVWLAHGYLSTRQFPGSTRLPDGSRDIGALEAGLLGVVDAASGAVAIYLLPDAGPLSRSWGQIAQGMIRPVAELAPTLAAAIEYPERLFEAQSRVLEQEPWNAGTLAGRARGGVGDPSPPTVVWEGGPGFALATGYQREENRRVRTLLLGTDGEGGRRLTLLRLGESGSLPAPLAAEATWDRFPSYEQMLDSVVRAGERFERGPYRILPHGSAPIAYQPWYAIGTNGRVSQPYVALASGTRVGAARTFAEAWANLQGLDAPLPPGFAPLPPLEEARRWMLRADSALHAGDWEGFGRAFGALRQTLGVGRAAP